MTLIEGTQPQRWIDLIFGLTEGWWLFEDFHLRPHHPLLESEEWKRLVGEVGFSKVAVIGGDETVGAALFQQSIIIAQAKKVLSAESDALCEGTGKKDGWLIFSDQGGFGRSLAEKLGSQGDFCCRTTGDHLAAHPRPQP